MGFRSGDQSKKYLSELARLADQRWLGDVLFAVRHGAEDATRAFRRMHTQSQ